MSAVLLDTCAVIWAFGGASLEPKAKRAIEAAERASAVWISPVTAWEIGLLARAKGTRGAKLQFLPSAQDFVDRVYADPAIQVAALTSEIAFAASYLPGTFHNDPADRFLLATARAMNLPIVTRDEEMEAYAAAGHVRVIVC